MSTTRPQTELQLGRIGDAVSRHDATPKVTGEFAYSSDLNAAGMLWGVTVRSPHAHAKIVELDISQAVRMPGVHAVLTHADGFRDVELGDQRVGVRAAQRVAPEHPSGEEVARVGELAGDLRNGVVASRRVADAPELELLRGAGNAHGCAASRTASKIFA